jgi:hypothetical protein
MPAFDRNRFDVMIVLMPACVMAPRIASVPIVKLRLTGVRPAMSVAMLASAPPTEAGSKQADVLLTWRPARDDLREKPRSNQRAAER